MPPSRYIFSGAEISLRHLKAIDSADDDDDDDDAQEDVSSSSASESDGEHNKDVQSTAKPSDEQQQSPKPETS